jgi:UDP-glucose 4-epimerase
MKTCLITGASGFVGCCVARRLLADGCSVHVLLREEHQPWRMSDIAKHVHTHQVDVLDEEKLKSEVKSIRPDWVFHLAAYGAYSWQNDVKKILLTNVVGTSNLVQACLETGFEAFINAGSSSEYGLTRRPPGEKTLLDPNSHYAVAKAAASHLCRHTAISRGLHLVTLRLYSVFGPYEDPHRLLPNVIVKGLSKRLPALVSPDVARDFVYTEDVVDAFLLAATAKTKEAGEIYNVGTGVQTTIRDVAEIAVREFGIEEGPVWNSMPNRAWDTTTWVCDNLHIRTGLGWTPKFDFSTGFRQMVNWFKENPQILQFYASKQL